jgi:hypothetical protein
MCVPFKAMNWVVILEMDVDLAVHHPINFPVWFFAATSHETLKVANRVDAKYRNRLAMSRRYFCLNGCEILVPVLDAV